MIYSARNASDQINRAARLEEQLIVLADRKRDLRKFAEI
jgi:hypothetical protein